MNKNYKFSVMDEKYKEEIIKMVDEVTAAVVAYYEKNRYDLTITEVTYSSDAINREAKIKFTYDSKSPYPAFDVKISNLGSAFRTPIQRLLDGVFILKGTTKEFNNELYTVHGVTSLFLVSHDDRQSDRGNPTTRIEYLLKEAHERLEAWRGWITAYDIFVF